MTERLTRRALLGRASLGLGALALDQLRPGRADVAPRRRAPRAKRVIFLCMAGGPSQLELFDEKPELAKRDGQPMPESITNGEPIAQLQGKPLKCMGPRVAFRPRGESGVVLSDWVPHLAKFADRLTVIRSMVTDQINHDPAHQFLNTGTIQPNRPCMGSWITYGLGAESSDLPGFVVLTSKGGRNPQPIAARQWSSGFLPSRFQGVEFHASGDPVHYIHNPPGVDAGGQRDVLDAVGDLNRLRYGQTRDPEIESRIAQAELAFRMQAAIPELMDVSDESPATLAMYGARPGDGSFASNCLLARRLAERGVRFIQLYHRGWDHHDGIVKYMDICTRHCDRASAALLADLERRGMLDDTLVVWGGEFGRTPMSQGGGKDPGRDHHIKGYSMALAGGGVRGGFTYGATDDFGYHAVEDVVHVRDLHATMLHLLGIEHETFSVPYQGLRTRLTGVEPARVLHDVLA